VVGADQTNPEPRGDTFPFLDVRVAVDALYVTDDHVPPKSLAGSIRNLLLELASTWPATVRSLNGLDGAAVLSTKPKDPSIRCSRVPKA
jgi:hypothetical protein